MKENQSNLSMIEIPDEDLIQELLKRSRRTKKLRKLYMMYIDILMLFSRHIRKDCSDQNPHNIITCIRCSLIHFKKAKKWDSNYILEMFLRISE